MQKTCKLLVLGDSGVGKTSLIHSFVSEEFRSDFKATLGADMSSKTFFIKDKKVEAQIWDTAGTERFRSMTMSHYRGADACILVYDVTSHYSFERLSNWRRDIIDSAGIDNPETFPFVLFANKCDIPSSNWEVSNNEAKQWAEQKNMPLFLVSAKTGENVNSGFIALLESYVSTLKQPYVQMQMYNLQENNKSKKCC